MQKLAFFSVEPKNELPSIINHRTITCRNYPYGLNTNQYGNSAHFFSENYILIVPQKT